jgi:hypothetical protein
MNKLNDPAPQTDDRWGKGLIGGQGVEFNDEQKAKLEELRIEAINAAKGKLV